MRPALLVLVGCAARQAEPLGNAGEVVPAPTPPPTKILVKRPVVDLAPYLPDPTEEARWPLPASQHPAFEPRYDIAGALAQPGIDWLKLCRMGAQNRHLSGNADLGTYLRAWCAAADGRIPDAVAALGMMGTPTVSGMPAAIRCDIANLLVQQGDAEHAAHVLIANKLDRLEELDLLAASYFETSHFEDALAINQRALESAEKTTPTERCYRLARKVLLSNTSTRGMWLLDLDKASLNQSKQTECTRLDDELRCAVRMECEGFMYQDADRLAKLALINSYKDWPRKPVGRKEWFEVAALARKAQPLQGWAALASAAESAAEQLK